MAFLNEWSISIASKVILLNTNIIDSYSWKHKHMFVNELPVSYNSSFSAVVFNHAYCRLVHIHGDKINEKHLSSTLITTPGPTLITTLNQLRTYGISLLEETDSSLWIF